MEGTEPSRKVADPEQFPIWRQFRQEVRNTVNAVFSDAPFEHHQQRCPLGLALWIAYGVRCDRPDVEQLAGTVFLFEHPRERLQYGDSFLKMLKSQARSYSGWWDYTGAMAEAHRQGENNG